MRRACLAMLLAWPALAGATEFQRVGWELAPMLGAAAGTDGPVLQIQDVRFPDLDVRFDPDPAAGFAFGARFAYRPIPWVGPWFDTGLGFSGEMVFSVAAGVAVYPIHFGRFDPHVDLGGGYAYWSASDEVTVRNQSADIRGSLHGGAFHVGVGVPVFVLPWLSVGPAFRYDLAFWQEACFDTPGADTCEAIEDWDRLSPGFEDSLPALWRAGLEVVFHPSRWPTAVRRSVAWCRIVPPNERCWPEVSSSATPSGRVNTAAHQQCLEIRLATHEVLEEPHGVATVPPR